MKDKKFHIFKTVIALLFAGVFFKMGWDDVKLYKEFQKYGITTQATLIGYEYWESPQRKSKGDVPLLSYSTLNNQQYTHLAHEYGIANEFQKQNLAKQKIYITYLSSNPSIAVVNQWNKPDYQYAAYFWGCLFLIGVIAGLVRLIYSTSRSNNSEDIS